LTKARDLANLISGGFTEADIPNLSASKITSGTFADARISNSSVSQYASTFDDNKIVNDISTLGLRVHTQENLNASNTNSASFDVFQDSSGITNLTNTQRSTDEYVSSVVQGTAAYETGDRRSSYTMLHTGFTPYDNDPGSLLLLLNGNFGANGSNGMWWGGNGSPANGCYIYWDLGSGNSKVYTGAKWYADRNSTHGTWKWQGSNDNVTYTDLSSNFTLGGQSSPYVTEVTWTNIVAYRYIKITGVSGNINHDTWHTEVEFKVKPVTTSATGSFENNAITAASTNKMGAVITYQDNAGTNTLNTDIILKLSADNGSNYSTATLTALPDFATGIKMAKVNDLSVTAGTQLKYKLEFANQASGSKEARIRGVSLQY
jgi:hypothetical protein